MTSGQVSENKQLTAREKWLREHREVRLYLKRDEYELLESLASEEGLTIRDFILKLAMELKQLKAESSILEKMGVKCKPGRVIECINELKVKWLIQMLDYAICMERFEALKNLLSVLRLLRSH